MTKEGFVKCINYMRDKMNAENELQDIIKSYQDILTDGLVPIDNIVVEMLDLMDDVLHLQQDDYDGSTLYRWVFEWEMGTKFKKGMICNKELPETDLNREPDLATPEQLYDYLVWEGTAHPRQITEKEKRNRFLHSLHYMERKFEFETDLTACMWKYESVLQDANIPSDIGSDLMIRLLEDWLEIPKAEDGSTVLSWWCWERDFGKTFEKGDIRVTPQGENGPVVEPELETAEQLYDFLMKK